jgi:hypothetical protein
MCRHNAGSSTSRAAPESCISLIERNPPRVATVIRHCGRHGIASRTPVSQRYIDCTAAAGSLETCPFYSDADVGVLSIGFEKCHKHGLGQLQ